MPDTVVQQLDAAEAEMFRIMAAGDAEAFERIAGSDYLTINADGVMLDRAGAKAIIGKFKGVTTEFAGRQRRMYGSTSVITGKATFRLKGIPLAKVHFTQMWV